MTDSSLTRLLEQRKKVFYGWWIAIAGAIQDALKGGTFNEGFLFYFLPITRDLEISRAAASLPFSLAKLEGAFEGPIVGYLIDRFGPRSMVVAGGFLSGLGFVLLSFTHSYIVFLLVFVCILSVGFKAGYNHAMLASINTWFIRRKGLAMSFVSTGSAVGGLVITPLVAFVVFTMGWRTAALMSGLAIWLIVIPLALVVKRSPESMGLLPDGERPRRSLGGTAGRSVSRATSGFEYTVRQAARTPAFWMFAMAHSFRNVGHGGIFVHLVPVLVWKGVQEEDTTFYIVFMLFTIMAMRLFMGWMGDLWSRQKVASLGVSLGIVGMGMLAFSSGRWWELTLFVFLFGTADSVNSTANAMVGDLFGRRNFATLRGWMGLISSFLPMAAPVFTGRVFDQTGSYDLVLWVFSGAYVASAVLYWTIPKPKPPPGWVPGQPTDERAGVGGGH